MHVLTGWSDCSVCPSSTSTRHLVHRTVTSRLRGPLSVSALLISSQLRGEHIVPRFFRIVARTSLPFLLRERRASSVALVASSPTSLPPEALCVCRAATGQGCGAAAVGLPWAPAGHRRSGAAPVGALGSVHGIALCGCAASPRGDSVPACGQE